MTVSMGKNDIFPQHLPNKNKYEHQLYETIVTEAD